MEAEFCRRDPIPELDLRVHNQGEDIEDIMEWEDLVMVRQFRDLPEALLAKGSLESAGIEAVLVDDNMIRMDWFISNLLGGIKLCVREPDEEAAFNALEQPTPASIEVEGVGTYDQPSCPRCRSLDVTFEALNRPIAPLRRKRWKCNACAQMWKTELDSSKPPEHLD